MAQTLEFFEQVITTPKGWLCLATLSNDGWREHWFKWPEQKKEVETFVETTKSNGSVYFTPHLYSQQSSKREHVLMSRTISADLDYAIAPPNLQPTVLVKTSPERHQGYWVLEHEPDTIEELESLSRSLTYAIPFCDKGCWNLGHKMRVPGSANYKYPDHPSVEVVNASFTPYKSLPLRSHSPSRNGASALEDDWTPFEVEDDPQQLLASVRPKIPARVYSQYKKRQDDRSAALFALMTSCFRAGLSRDQVFHIANHSANNKFKESRYNADRDLARDVLRAEAASTTDQSNIKALIKEARRGTGTAAEKRRILSFIVHEDMEKRGNFLSTPEGEYYVRRDTGRAIYLGRSSPWLNAYLENQYELNVTEPEQKYVCGFLESWTKEHGRKATAAQLCYYDQGRRRIYLHTGMNLVLSISKDDIQEQVNGEYDILFPGSAQSEPFVLTNRRVRLDKVFEGCFDNVIDMEPDEAMALVKAWFYFLFFKETVISRPIMAFFGQPGAGKSTLFRRIYRVLYGQYKAVNSVTKPEEFDHAVSKDPLVVFDNVDTWSSWLPDKLALSAAVSDIEKRRLYTDNDTAIVKRRALIGVTAHNPKFRREDIVDRLLILMFERLKAFRSETQLLQEIYDERDAIWSSIVDDLQRVLATPFPDDSEVPTFRISDFAKIGLWIARGLGFEAEFQSGLAKNVNEQLAYNLEEEQVLINALRSWLRSRPDRSGKFYRVADLHNELVITASEEFQHQFSRSIILGRKLWSLQSTLNSVFVVNVKHGLQREWSFAEK